MYKNKETAIKTLRFGKNFKLKIFDNFRDDKEVALAAVSKDGGALEDCSPRLKDDKEVALAAVSKNAWAIKYCSPRLKDNKEVALTAVSKNGRALEICSDRLKDNKEVALAAINQDGLVLYFCSDRLKDNKQVALAAVSQDGRALRFCSENIKKLCQGQDPIEALTKAIESEKLYEQLQKEIKPNGLDFAKTLSAECKQNTMEQSKPKARMKI